MPNRKCAEIIAADDYLTIYRSIVRKIVLPKARVSSWNCESSWEFTWSALLVGWISIIPASPIEMPHPHGNTLRHGKSLMYRRSNRRCRS